MDRFGVEEETFLTCSAWPGWHSPPWVVCWPGFTLFLIIVGTWSESWSFCFDCGLDLRQNQFITGEKVEIFGCVVKCLYSNLMACLYLGDKKLIFSSQINKDLVNACNVPF